MEDVFPAEMVGMATLEEKAGMTKLTLRYDGIPDRQTREMILEGWDTSLEKFTETLAELEEPG